MFPLQLPLLRKRNGSSSVGFGDWEVSHTISIENKCTMPHLLPHKSSPLIIHQTGKGWTNSVKYNLFWEIENSTYKTLTLLVTLFSKLDGLFLILKFASRLRFFDQAQNAADFWSRLELQQLH